jgi:hypothetical protein
VVPLRRSEELQIELLRLGLRASASEMEEVGRAGQRDASMDDIVADTHAAIRYVGARWAKLHPLVCPSR